MWMICGSGGSDAARNTDDVFFPTCQVRVVRFYQSSSPLPLLFLFSSSPLLLLIRVFLTTGCTSTASSRSQWAILQLHVHDRSGHSRTSTASARSELALPDLNSKRQIAVGTAGPQLQAPDRSGHCRTSTASSRSQWALPGLNCKRQIAVGTACLTSTTSARSQWAIPDLNSKRQIAVGTAGSQQQVPDRSGHYRTSIASAGRQIAVGMQYRTSTASARSQWALPHLNSKRQIAGAQQQAPDRSWQCGTSTGRSGHYQQASCSIAVGAAGPQPPVPDRSGRCWTSKASSRSRRAPPDLAG